MTSFIGDHKCKVDAKGRIMLPSAFKKQLSPQSNDRFIVKMDIYEKCLVLYPWDEWQRQHKIIRKNINTFNQDHNKFLREFSKGSAEINIDSNNRILISKRLFDKAEINKEVVLIGLFGKIEIWSKELYDSSGITGKDFAKLADKILGGSINYNDEDIS